MIAGRTNRGAARAARIALEGRDSVRSGLGEDGLGLGQRHVEVLRAQADALAGVGGWVAHLKLPARRAVDPVDFAGEAGDFDRMNLHADKLHTKVCQVKPALTDLRKNLAWSLSNSGINQVNSNAIIGNLYSVK